MNVKQLILDELSTKREIKVSLEVLKQDVDFCEKEMIRPNLNSLAEFLKPNYGYVLSFDKVKKWCDENKIMVIKDSPEFYDCYLFGI